jgi:Predicted membrane protein
MMIAFGVIGIYPFGQRQIMVIDSWHQYYPFLQELHTKLQSGGSIFYSWDMGMGVNFFLVMAYYAFSPLYALSIIFPKEYLREFMMLATALKIAFAGAFFSIYLKHVFKREDYSIVGFGLLYAFCGYAMGYYWNIMWLDAMALFPLIILGLNNIIEGKGFKLYVITLAIALISNFYIGFFICEFILIYYFILYFSKTKKFSFNHFIKRSFEIALYSFIALGLAAIVLIPTYDGLLLSQAVNGTKPSSFKTYFSILELINNTLPGTKPTVKSGLPNIFSSFLALYMVVVYFMSNKIKVKEKFLYLGLIVFFILSFNINYLNYVWHAFHFPNEVPYRFAFMFSFVILTMAYKGFQHFETITKKQVGTISAGILIYLIINEAIGMTTTVLYVSLGALALYTIVFMLRKYNTIRKKAYLILFSILVLSEALISAILGTATTGSSSRSTYPYLGDEVKMAVADVYEKDQGFYRMDMIKHYSTNDPALYGYRGVSMFSSTVNSNISNFLKQIGIAASPASNRYIFAASTPIVNGMLDVNYFIGRNEMGTEENAGYELFSKNGPVSIYKNKYPLSIGFRVDYAAYNWNNNLTNPFDVQEDFLKTSLGKAYDVFTNVPISSENYDNMERIKLSNDLRYAYKNLNSSKVGNAVLTFNAPETKQMYLFMFANRSYKTKVTVNEKTVEYETRRGLTIDLGVLEKGAEIKLEFEVHAANDGYFNLQAVTFDENLWQEAYTNLADEQLNITSFSDTKIKGNINALDDGFIYTSIPYEPGWTVKVDGEEVLVEALKNAMIAVDVEAGYHEIEFSYLPNGLKSGLVVTLISLIGFILLIHFSPKEPEIDLLAEDIEEPIDSEKPIDTEEITIPTETETETLNKD